MPHSEINLPTTAKTVIPECGALLQILLNLVTFCNTCDCGMWRYGITVISHEANPVKTLGGIDSYATSQDQFAAEPYIRYNSGPVASHSTIIGIVDVALCYYTICCTFIKHAPLKGLLSC
jgi:hypothetical protein